MWSFDCFWVVDKGSEVESLRSVPDLCGCNKFEV